MAKVKLKYVCSACGFESFKWLGKCPDCGEWNTFSEELSEKKTITQKIIFNPNKNIVNLSEQNVEQEFRIRTNISEFDRVLGGGLINGSVILIGGDPGIGKSTLVLQMAEKIGEKVLYVTGEESLKQISIRATRLKANSKNILALAETNIDIIISAIENVKPKIVIIDSIQTMFSSNLDNAPGTVTQIRESTLELMQFAKKTNTTFIIIGHVTKEGVIAGPKVLEHIVDAVLQFEGERNNIFRILRGQKNRYGSTNEIGIFEMRDTGLIEVTNPSKLFLNEHSTTSSGTVITASMEGTRPLLLEIQALVTPSHFGNPQRLATGFDYKRLSILLAVLEKRSGMRVGTTNVFLNVAGGMKIFEPAADLAACCSIISSLKDQKIKNSIVVIGEIGLNGEVRSVSHINQRVNEALKLGFEDIILPATNFENISKKIPVNLLPVKSINEAIEKIF